MNETLRAKAEWLIDILNQFPEVETCRLYGSLVKNTADALSDIDLEMDVVGMDDAAFVLTLPDRLKEKIPVFYADYAPSLAPERYVVSLALDETNPFLIADLCCHSSPHSNALTRDELRKRNDPYTHMLKLWTANLKHHARKADCREDILRMAEKLGIQEAWAFSNDVLLEKVLMWLEENAPSHLRMLAESCRKAYDSMVHRQGG